MEEVFPLDDFLNWFTEFTDETKYSRQYVQSSGDKAILHIGPHIEGMPLEGRRRAYAQCLMCAHLIELDNSDDANGTGATGAVFKASVGTVSVETTKQNSFNSDDWNYWLNQTKHGRELLAFLDLSAPAGVYLNNENDSVRDLV